MAKKVFGVGPLDADIMIVGEAPGKDEVRKGKPFVGRSGSLLNSLLHNAGIARSDCRITNVIKELPKKRTDFIKFKSNGGAIKSDEYVEYEEMLYREIEQSSAKVIVAVGNVSLYALCGLRKITKRRGSVYSCMGKKVIPIVHPAYILRVQWVPRMFHIKYTTIHDLIKAKKIAKGSFSQVERELLTGPSFTEAMSFLDSIGDMTSFDIEVVNEEVSCISFSPDKSISMCVPFVKDGREYFTPKQERDIWVKIAEVLESPDIRCVGQNVMFDSSFLLRKMGIHSNNLGDTMVAQAIVLPGFPKGLDYIASIYTTIPYWKDDGKKYKHKWVSDEKFWRYNALDSAACSEAMPNLIEDLKKTNNLDTYKRQIGIIPPLLYIGESGIKVEVNKLKSKYNNNIKKLEKMKKEFYKMCGSQVNPLSPKQLKKYFYVDKGLKPYKNKGKITTDETAMKRLARRDFREARKVLDIRRLNKMNSTYYDPGKISEDGRLRCSFNPVGTPNGRVSSSATIFGEGMNFQNIPYEARKYMIADEGYTMYVIDLEQAENRIVAYVAPEPLMIKAFEKGIDIHSQTGALISGLHIDKVKQQDEEGVKVDIGDGSHTWRHWGKKANHGLNYGLGYKNFALINEIPEGQGKKIVEKYHQIYPGIRSYHNWIVERLKKDRTIENCFGRKRTFYGKWGDHLFKQAYNFIPQSTVADIINEWGLIYLYKNQHTFGAVELKNTTHDSVTIQIPDSIGRNYHMKVLKLLKRSLEQEITWSNRTFSIPIEVEQGKNLKETEVINI